jgi:hypothetical protein
MSEGKTLASMHRADQFERKFSSEAFNFSLDPKK